MVRPTFFQRLRPWLILAAVGAVVLGLFWAVPDAYRSK